jgi:outer membrane protein assembly factor BamB
LLSSLAIGPFTHQAPPQGIDRVLGAWQGTVEHHGETAVVIFEFVRSRDRVLALASVPMNAAWRFPVAVVTMTGDVLSAGPMRFEFNPAADTLTTTLPAEMVPKYTMREVLKRRGPVTPEARPASTVPVRKPSWTLQLGAPSWADTAIVGGLVITGAEDGRLHAVGADGRERWTFQAGGAIRAAATPIDADLLVPADDGVLYRLDASSGRERWRTTIGKPWMRVALDNPASRYENRASAAAVDGGRVFVGTHDGRLIGLDARSGAERWVVTAGDAITATPVVRGGRVYAGSYDGFVYGVDAATGAVIWKHQTGGPVTTAVAVGGGRVIAGSRSYDLEALDERTGETMWTYYVWFSWVESPLTLDGGTAYVGSSDAARLFAIDARSGRARWAADAGGSAWGQPVVAADAVYESVAGVLNYLAPHGGSVVAVDKRSGRVLWRFPAAPPSPAPSTLTPFGFAGSIAIDRTSVYAAGLDGVLYAFPR